MHMSNFHNFHFAVKEKCKLCDNYEGISIADHLRRKHGINSRKGQQQYNFVPAQDLTLFNKMMESEDEASNASENTSPNRQSPQKTPTPKKTKTPKKTPTPKTTPTHKKTLTPKSPTPQRCQTPQQPSTSNKHTYTVYCEQSTQTDPDDPYERTLLMLINEYTEYNRKASAAKRKLMDFLNQ
jgi:hypothetical protein